MCLTNSDSLAIHLIANARDRLQITSYNVQLTLEHSNSRFESIRFYSLWESIRIDSFSKKSAFRFTNCQAVFSSLFIV